MSSHASEKTWKQCLHSGCQCYFLQVPVVSQSLIEIGRGKAQNPVSGSLQTFWTFPKLFSFFFLSNLKCFVEFWSKLSEGSDRLFFKSFRIDSRCLKWRRGAASLISTGMSVCSSYLCVFWAQLLGQEQWSKARRPENHYFSTSV